MKKLIISFMVLVAMIGTVAAYTPSIWDADGNGPITGDITLKPGESVNLSYRMENINSDEYNRELFYSKHVSVVSGPGTTNDITIKTPESVIVPQQSEYTHTNVITIKIDSNAPKGTLYRISIGAGDVALESDFEIATSIPEFPTIALPIVAILGLAFFMQRRKEE
jgi:hypothetical protein